MSKKRVRAPDWKEVRRYRPLELKRVGWTPEEIAEALDVSARSVKKWMKAVREEGETSLQSRPHLGVPPRLLTEEWLCSMSYSPQSQKHTVFEARFGQAHAWR